MFVLSLRSAQAVPIVRVVDIVGTQVIIDTIECIGNARVFNVIEFINLLQHVGSLENLILEIGCGNIGVLHSLLVNSVEDHLCKIEEGVGIFGVIFEGLFESRACGIVVVAAELDNLRAPS